MSDDKTPRRERVEALATEYKIPRHEADRLLANMNSEGD